MNVESSANGPIADLRIPFKASPNFLNPFVIFLNIPPAGSSPESPPDGDNDTPSEVSIASRN